MGRCWAFSLGFNGKVLGEFKRTVPEGVFPEMVKGFSLACQESIDWLRHGKISSNC